MKAIMMSIKPKWVEKILNDEKTIEIRKKFPIDYVGWVYIYVTKAKPCLVKSNETKTSLFDINGKAVARFWCDKVEKIIENYPLMYKTETLNCEELEKQSCLTYDEIDNYLFTSQGYAIHITKLEIFDKPKEISEFIFLKKNVVINGVKTLFYATRLTRAPQSYCFIEI